MKIRVKLILGFVVLATMLFISGLWSIYEFNSISNSIGGILKENYQSINSANNMIRATEIQEDGIYLIMLNQNKKGLELVKTGDSLFVINYIVARNNVTIKNEGKYLDTINALYGEFNTLTRNLDKKSIYQNIEICENIKSKLFVAINKLININDMMMNETVSNLKSKADRAIAPGIIAIIAVFVFIILFSYLINYYLVNPIISITKGINKLKDNGKAFDIKIESKDEISDLANSVRDLYEYLKYKEDK
ncbi:MAG: methyl-accepting chemotaxis protein [Ignavibacteriales bacterium]|nr:methyl-accepting chemotaxis protein [Ignavibacteriales bacterium]